MAWKDELGPIENIGDPPWLLTADKFVVAQDFFMWAVRNGRKYKEGELPWKPGDWQWDKEDADPRSDGVAQLYKLDPVIDGLDRLMFDQNGIRLGLSWKAVYEVDKEKIQAYCDMYAEGYAPYPVNGARHEHHNQFAVMQDDEGYARALAAYIMKKPLYMWVIFPSLERTGKELKRREACRWAAEHRGIKAPTPPEVLREYIEEDWAVKAMRRLYPDHYDELMRNNGRAA